MGVAGGCLSGPSSRRQVILFGLDGAGKTTLLYRLKMPFWTTITQDLQQVREKKEDPGYHYEELQGIVLESYGMWDVPGTKEMIDMWPTFYRYLQISAVIFVVDGLVVSDDLIRKNRRLMYRLLSEDELRSAAFVCLINTRKPEKKKNEDGPPLTEEEQPKSVEELKRAIGADVLEKIHDKRFKTFELNCSECVSTKSEWMSVEKHILHVIRMNNM